MANLEYNSYYERFFMEFDSEPNDKGEVFHYRVSFQQRLHLPSFTPAPTPLRLEGGPSPFVVSLQNNDDPLVPMRTASARISFANDVALSELFAVDALEWRVTLTRVEDEKRVFVGYLTAEVYTQPASDGPTIYTVNAASPMVPISATAMAFDGKGMVSIGELIKMAADTTILRDIDRVCFPAIYSVKDSSEAKDYAEVMQWQFSSGNFLEYNENEVVGRQAEYDTYSAAFNAVCTLFGWSMVDCGDGALYFISPAYQGQYIAVEVDQLTDSFTPSLITPRLIDSTSLFSTDNADSVEYKQGVGSVSITPSVKDVKLFTPNYVAKAKGWEYTFRESKITTIPEGTNAWTAYVGKVEAKQAPILEFPRYRATLTNVNPPAASWEAVTDGTVNEERDVQVILRRIDSCSEADLSGGEDAKKAWQFEDSILLKDFIRIGSTTLFPDNTLPLIRFKGLLPMVSTGAIRINFSLRATPQDGYYQEDNTTLSGGASDFDRDVVPPILVTENGVVDADPWPTEDGEHKMITASLRVGNAWWNGSAWNGTFDTFEIPISSKKSEWHTIVSNKIITMPFGGDSGYFAEIYYPYGIEVEFCIYPGISAIRDGSEDYYPLTFEMKGVALEYAPHIDYVASASTDDTVYARELLSRFKEEKSVSLPLHSRIDNGAQLSLMYAKNNPLDTLYRSTASFAAKLEQFLLDEYERVYGRTLRRWRRGTWAKDFNPTDVYNIASADSVAVLTGYTADYAEATAEVYLSDVKTINTTRNVE